MKAIATLTIRDADRTSAEGRKEIAEWLRKQAKALVKNGDNYAPQFRARYLNAVESVNQKEVAQ